MASCHEDEITVSSVDAKLKAYEKIFKEEFGTINVAQDWGFGSESTKVRTRSNGIDGAINVNGNQWTGAPAVEVPGEVNAIYDYVKYTLPEMDRLGHLYSTTAPENLNGYFVTQVRNGLNDDNKDKNANNSWVTNEGNYMNHLQIAFNSNPTMADLNGLSDQAGWNANESGWEHINNFNASQNANWANDQSELHGNTKVENKGAHDFAYHNSLDSKYHNNWILVDGYYITEDHRFANFYYVCFDFESMPDGVKTEFTFTGKNGSGVDQTGYNGKVDGYYSSVDDIKAAWTAAGTTTFTGADGAERNISEMKDITITGYEKGDKIVFPDDVHTDWIIRITKGAPGSTVDETNIPIDRPTTNQTTISVKETPRYWEERELIEQGRVICEDLGTITNPNVDVARQDIDFNDVVFDAYIYKVTTWTETIKEYPDGTTSSTEGEKTINYTTKIVLLAAGGTLPLTVADVDVHSAFGTGVTTIVNTIPEGGEAYGNNYVTRDPVELNSEFDEANDKHIRVYTQIKDIPIIVQVNTRVGVLELNAEVGKTPNKILVDIGTKWPKERKKINTVYLKFNDYVSSRYDCWNDNNNIDSGLLYYLDADVYQPLSTEAVRTYTDGQSTNINENSGPITTGGYQGGEYLVRRRN